MSKIKLNLSYPVNDQSKATPEEIDKARTEVSRGYIEYALTAHFKDGVDGQTRRKVGRIQTAIEQSITDKTYELELQDQELRLLQDAFLDDKVKFTASLSQFVIMLEDEIMKDINLK
jgi:hypothetical protein